MNDPLTSPGESPDPSPQRNQELARLQAAIARGFDAEAFLGTSMGHYIRERASRELEEAQDALLSVDAADAPAIRELQLQGRVAGRVLTYFADMVAEAEAAQEQHRLVFDSGNHTD